MRIVSECANQKLAADNAHIKADELAAALEFCLAFFKKTGHMVVDVEAANNVIADCEAILSSYYGKESP